MTTVVVNPASDLLKIKKENTDPAIVMEVEARVNKANGETQETVNLLYQLSQKIGLNLEFDRSVNEYSGEANIYIKNLTLTEAQMGRRKRLVEESSYLHYKWLHEMTENEARLSPDTDGIANSIEEVQSYRMQLDRTSEQRKLYPIGYANDQDNESWAGIVFDDRGDYRGSILEIILREYGLSSPLLNQSPQKVFERQQATLDLLEWASPSN